MGGGFKQCLGEASAALMKGVKRAKIKKGSQEQKTVDLKEAMEQERGTQKKRVQTCVSSGRLSQIYDSDTPTTPRHS